MKTYGGISPTHTTESNNIRVQILSLMLFYVGALIEELDMRDIQFSVRGSYRLNDDINDVSECGKVYTDKEDIIRLYDNLLEGSENHLKAYVKNIEKVIGEGNYEAQYLRRNRWMQSWDVDKTPSAAQVILFNI